MPNKKNNSQTKNKNDTKLFEDKIEKIREALRENYLQQKKLMNDLRELLVLYKNEVKLSNNCNRRSGSGQHSGFNKLQPVPPELKKLLKIREDILPRSKVTSLLYQYFTDNKMYNDKKDIIPNQKIKKIFGMKDDDTMNFYNLQIWLRKVYNENPNNSIKLKD